MLYPNLIINGTLLAEFGGGFSLPNRSVSADSET